MIIVDFPKLNITQQAGLIGINTRPGQLSIKQPKADLNIQQPPADLKFERKPSKLTIDQSQVWKELNIIGPLESTKQNAEEGEKKVLEGMAKVANEGDRLMRIENGGDQIPEIAKQNIFKEYQPIQMEWIPSNFAVKFKYEPGEVNINAKANKPIIEANANSPIIQYEKSEMNIYLEQEPYIEINFDNVKYKNLGFEMHI